MVLAKPVMRGMLAGDIKRNLPIAILVATTATLAVKFLYNEPLKQKYADFYKDYDANEAFERLRKRGVFQSCK